MTEFLVSPNDHETRKQHGREGDGGRRKEGEKQLHFQSGSLHCQGGEDTGESAALANAAAEAFQAGVFMSYGRVVRVRVGVWVPPPLTSSPQRSHFRDARSEIERPRARQINSETSCRVSPAVLVFLLPLFVCNT